MDITWLRSQEKGIKVRTRRDGGSWPTDWRPEPRRASPTMRSNRAGEPPSRWPGSGERDRAWASVDAFFYDISTECLRANGKLKVWATRTLEMLSKTKFSDTVGSESPSNHRPWLLGHPIYSLANDWMNFHWNRLWYVIRSVLSWT